MTILLIEDDDAMRGGLEGNLPFDGFGVIAYAAVEDLPELEALAAVDVVLADYQLPGESGLDFADRFHARRPAVPMILMTAHCSHDLEAKVARRPYLRLLRKPFDYDELLSLVTALAGPPPSG